MATAIDLDCPIFQKVGTGEQGIGLIERELQFADSIELDFGDAQDVQARWDGTDFDWLAAANNSIMKWGTGTKSFDIWWYGSAATNYLEWDASANALYLRGAASLFQQAAQANVTGSGVALSASKTAAFRIYADDGQAAMTSAVFARAGVFRHLQTYTAGNREQEAAGVVGQIVSVAGTNRHNMCGVMGSYEAQTSLTVDGQASATDPWCQAAVIGRVGVGTAITTINANGKLAGLAAMSNTVSFTANNGVYTGLYVGRWSGATDWGYGAFMENVAVGIELTATGNGANVTSTTLDPVTGRVGKFYGTMAAPNMADGYGAFEVDFTLSGTMGSTGFANASSSWVNIPTGTVGAGKYVCARNDGVYEATAAVITNAKIIFGARMHKLLDDTDALSFPFSLNTNNTAITALFDCNNITDFGTVANAGSSAATLVPFLRNAAGTLKYVLLYDLA